ncbi:MAG TPA: acyltransferase [Anaerolineales bacterium]|nr:acyltransferase [Anaerolineales bacterium]
MKIKSLDGLRGIAILSVMILHLVPTLPPAPTPLFSFLYKLSSFGQMGVDLFFVLSGFLITRILYISHKDRFFFKNFYIRRALRIFPLYYLFLTLSFLIFPLLIGNKPLPLREQAWYFFYIHNIAYTFNLPLSGAIHLWSLAVEEHFYLVWPLCIKVFEPKRTLWLSISIIFVAFITRFILIEFNFNAFYFSVTRADNLALGAILAYLELQKKLKSFLLIFGIGSVGLSLSLMGLWLIFGGDANRTIQLIKPNLIGLLMTCLVGLAIAMPSTSPYYRMLCNRFLTFTGSISYGLYLFHGDIFLFSKFLTSKLLINNWVHPFLAMILSFLICWLLFEYFEKYFLSFKEKLTHQENLSS